MRTRTTLTTVKERQDEAEDFCRLYGSEGRQRARAVKAQTFSYELLSLVLKEESV